MGERVARNTTPAVLRTVGASSEWALGGGRQQALVAGLPAHLHSVCLQARLLPPPAPSCQTSALATGDSHVPRDKGEPAGGGWDWAGCPQ